MSYSSEEEQRPIKKPKSSLSTFKGTMMYRVEMQECLKAFYDDLKRMPMPDAVESIVSSFRKNHIAFFPSDSKWMRDHVPPVNLADNPNVDEALIQKGKALLESCLSWSGSGENDKWLKLAGIVESALPSSARTVQQLSWKLDSARYPTLQRPWTSIFIPDFAAGFQAGRDIKGNYRRMSSTFLKGYSSLVEPSTSPFPNETNPFCFPFFVWERKTDLDSSLYKAQNQLALPMVKMLDLLDSLGLNEMPVFGLVTLGGFWELWIGYAHPETGGEFRYVFRRFLSDTMNELSGAVTFYRMLESLGAYFETDYRPKIVNTLTKMSTKT